MVKPDVYRVSSRQHTEHGIGELGDTTKTLAKPRGIHTPPPFVRQKPGVRRAEELGANLELYRL